MREKQCRAFLSASQKQKGDETDSSDSEDEPVLDDDSDDLFEVMNELCAKCQYETRSKVRIKCALCDSWWHAECVSEMDLTEKSQEGIDALDFDFFVKHAN